MEPTLHNKAEITCLCLAREIHKADEGPTEFTVAFEETLARTISKEYLDVAEKAVKAGMRQFKGGSTAAQVRSVMAAINGQMEKFGSKSLRSTIEDELAIFYEEVTTKFLKQYKLTGTKKAIGESSGGSITGSFTLVDRGAVETIQKLTVQTAGTYYPQQIQGITSEVVREVILESGLSIDDAAIKLENEIRGALGAEKAAQVVPARFASNPQNYFQIVSSNASVQATSVGRIVAMSDAGVEKYRVSAVIDKRTSNICMRLDGKEFSVQKTMGTVNEFISLESTGGLKSLMPFNNSDIVPKWADEGLGFPPYHQKCRTTVVPVF